MKPLVSVIIPIYKVEEFIVRCIKSVYNQSYANIECILVNDQSPDNSVQIADDFLRQCEGFNYQIINQPKNMGLSMARNAGIDSSKGKYLYFLDSDDEITNFAIENLVTLAEKHQAELTLGHCVCINEIENWKRDYFPITASSETLEGHRQIFENFVEGKYPVMACDKLVRKDFILQHQLYFVQDLFSQDVLWSFQSALKLNKVAFLKEDTYLYYFHPASIIHNRGEKHFGNWITIAEYMDRAYLEESDTDTKQLILKYLVDFKNSTLEMNWKGQKNETLWKRSYKAYSKLNSFRLSDYFSSKYTRKQKKDTLVNTLPAGLSFKIFKWRYER